MKSYILIKSKNIVFGSVLVASGVLQLEKKKSQEQKKKKTHTHRD